MLDTLLNSVELGYTGDTHTARLSVSHADGSTGSLSGTGSSEDLALSMLYNEVYKLPPTSTVTVYHGPGQRTQYSQTNGKLSAVTPK